MYNFSHHISLSHYIFQVTCITHSNKLYHASSCHLHISIICTSHIVLSSLAYSNHMYITYSHYHLSFLYTLHTHMPIHMHTLIRMHNFHYYEHKHAFMPFHFTLSNLYIFMQMKLNTHIHIQSTLWDS